MQSSKVETILSAWQNEGEVLPYSRIKQFVVNRKLIKETNDRSLSRWLKNLVKDGILKKTPEGYALEMKPKEYQVFDYINELKQKYSRHVHEGEVGGIFSHICASTYLNFDETLLQEADEKIAFNELSVLLAEIFWALFMLKNTVIKRRCGLNKLQFPEEVIRGVFIAMLSGIIRQRSIPEVMKKYGRDFNPQEKESFGRLWNDKRPTIIDHANFVGEDFFFDSMPNDLKRFKIHLKKTASIDVDKYSVEELVEKFVKINERIEEKHEKEIREQHGFMFTKEESELESNFRMAILTKVVEAIRALGTDLEDFAIILTRHPSTLNQYYTPEHILHEAMEWAKKPPDDKWGKDIWNEIHDEEGTFEGMVAERLITFGHFSARIYARMRTLPWVRMELSKYGDFGTILRLYSTKRKEHLQRRKELFKKTSKTLLGVGIGRMPTKK
jgi:hypothetical protein